MLSDTQPITDNLLVHPEIQSGHSFTNVLLVDSQVTDYQVFVDSVNSFYVSHSLLFQLL